MKDQKMLCDLIAARQGTDAPFSSVMGIIAAGTVEEPKPFWSCMWNMVSPYCSQWETEP